MKKDKIDKILFLVGGVSAMLMMAIMNLIPPDSVPPLGILFIFILIYLICLSVVVILNKICETLILKVDVITSVGNNDNKKYLYLLTVSAAPVVLLAIQSVHNMSVIDVVLVFFIIAIICFYIKHH
ncbi:MAG: hypothetical protein Q3996_02815 [Candidatus Saccharibacteria bacterium]|nr:hypothetical protein [Candidatus Saccharibacteria bacterium]